MIEPTVGRVVWYYPPSYPSGPQAAIVTAVYTSWRISIIAFPPGEMPRPVTAVQLVQDDDERESYGYCTWMPYQKGQAAKTEALEQRITTSEAQVSQP